MWRVSFYTAAAVLGVANKVSVHFIGIADADSPYIFYENPFGPMNASLRGIASQAARVLL